MNRSRPVECAQRSLLTRDWVALLRGRAVAGLLAILACVCLLVYVFHLTPYQHFLYNDMLGYWNRAIERLNGQTFRETQFMAWPPIYHIYLAEFFRLCLRLGMASWVRLETILVANILLFAISVYAFHRIGARWFGDRGGIWTLLATVIYGFGFPAWYFNAFLLSENFSAPLLVIAIALVYCRKTYVALAAAAGIFALAAAARPAIAPYGLAFILPLLLRHGITREFFVRAALFSTVFFLLVAVAMAEVARISNGKVTGLSANGGLDFFIANSRYYRIDTSYEGWHNFVIVPALSWKPEQGSFQSNVPFYQQDYYFGLGWQHLQRDPSRLLRNVEHIKHLFFADMLPSRYDAPGFKTFRPLWDRFKFALFLSLPLYLWLWPRLADQQKYLASLLLSLIAVTMIVSYFFTGEPRYTYSIIFAFYLLGLGACRLAWREGRRLWRIVPSFILLLAAGWLSGKAFAHYLNPPGEPRIQAVLTATDASKISAQLPALYFPFNKKSPLVSEHGHMVLSHAGTLRFQSQLQLDEPVGKIGWEVFSSWPLRIFMDGELLMDVSSNNYFIPQTTITEIQPGEHLIEVEVAFSPGEVGLTINYMFLDSEQWLHREKLGKDTPPVRFSLPERDHDQ